jgi:thiosulfate reductase cytochrome b subunit
MNITGIGKVLMIVGAVLVLIGLVLVVKDKIPWVGRLPGDIYVKRNTFSCYFPLTTCIIISIVVTLLLTLFRK